MATEDATARFLWRDELVEQLIDLYKERPCLYNTMLKEYHDRDLKKKCHDEIAQILNTSSKSTIYRGYYYIVELVRCTYNMHFAQQVMGCEISKIDS